MSLPIMHANTIMYGHNYWSRCLSFGILVTLSVTPNVMQAAQDTVDSLQTQVLDLEIKLNQAKASRTDSEHSAAQDISKLQEQLRQSELKNSSRSDSDSSLRALTAEIAQLRSELELKAKETAASAAVAHAVDHDKLAAQVKKLQDDLQQAQATTASLEAASAAKAKKMQDKLQHAESTAAASAGAADKLAAVEKELAAAGSRISQLESSTAESEEHTASLQVRHDCEILPHV